MFFFSYKTQNSTYHATQATRHIQATCGRGQAQGFLFVVLDDAIAAADASCVCQLSTPQF